MHTRRLQLHVLIVFGILLPVAASIPSRAQDNYEIQVYGSDLVAPDHTMVELHSNFTVEAARQPSTASCPQTTPSMKPLKSHRASTTGSRPAFIFSPAFSLTAAGN